jgi:HEAT repeat protein
MQLLHSTNDHERGLSITGLGTLGKLSVKPLLEELSAENLAMRNSVLHALAAVGSQAEEALPAVIRIVQQDTNYLDRDTAIWCLGRIGKQPDVVVPIIMKVLEEGDPRLSVACVYSLGDFGAASKPALPLVLKVLEDPSPFTRDYASNALHRIDPVFANAHGIR